MIKQDASEALLPPHDIKGATADIGTVKRRRGRPRKQDKRNLADALIDAAENLLEQEGIGALTERRIAHGANVSEALIAYYFNDKNGLLFALAERRFAFIEATFNGLLEIEPTDPTASMQFARAMIEAHHARPWTARLMLAELQRREESSVWRQYVERRGSRSLVQIRKALLHQAAARFGAVTDDLDQATRVALSLMCITSGTLSLHALSEPLGISLGAMREEPWLAHVAAMVDAHLLLLRKS